MITNGLKVKNNILDSICSKTKLNKPIISVDLGLTNLDKPTAIQNILFEELKQSTRQHGEDPFWIFKHIEYTKTSSIIQNKFPEVSEENVFIVAMKLSLITDRYNNDQSLEYTKLSIFEAAKLLQNIKTDQELTPQDVISKLSLQLEQGRSFWDPFISHGVDINEEAVKNNGLSALAVLSSRPLLHLDQLTELVNDYLLFEYAKTNINEIVRYVQNEVLTKAAAQSIQYEEEYGYEPAVNQRQRL